MQIISDKMSFSIFYYYFCVCGGLLGYAEYRSSAGKNLGHL